MTGTLDVALIGQRFMGRAHSNAWRQVAPFFAPPLHPFLHTIAGRDPKDLESFAKQWGWTHWTTRWQDLAEDPEIDLVDIGTPNDVHKEQAIAMLEAGKHVACEKPLAGTLDDARAMRDAAKKARRKSKTFVWFNYRRCPAIGFARKLVQQGRLGKILHVRAKYLQSWGFADTPLLWRFEKKRAGSGAHGDLNAHSIDLARFLTGEEIVSVEGAIAQTFYKERALLGDAAQLGGKSKKTKKAQAMGKSTVDDALLFLARFAGGAVASFEATRCAHGHENRNTIELNGEKGSVRFDFEDMNVLELFDAEVDAATRGWRRIMCTTADAHPYAGNWWPSAHVIGYEHGFVNMAADILRVLGGQEPELPLPDFADAYEVQRVLEAAQIAAKQGGRIPLREVK
ncbi:MAG: Gfo/Idh/MocA family oxidoreductase [Planctomycetes bacterium]|nr:Gfo/Idh/MocA family oxidoreductase [Planctomycetota bacterium]